MMMMKFCIPVSWYAIFAPAGMSRDVVARINSDAKRALRPE
jgi:tripartite-type tricarboxylate transporter receptor subunit TctC